MKNKYYIKKLWFTGPEIEDSPIEFNMVQLSADFFEC